MDEVEGKGHQIVHSQIVAHGTVPDCDEAAFAQAAEAADAGCPVLRADPCVRHGRRLRNTVARAPVDRDPRRPAMATDRTMSTTWNGTLMDGAGTIHEAGSGAFGPLEVSWASRAEAPNGKTSPEELIAAAHSACFSMALAHGLAQAGTPADQLDTSATVTFVPGDGDHEDRAHACAGACRGSTRTAFVAAAEGAKVGCPVSKALAGVPEITLDAALA